MNRTRSEENPPLSLPVVVTIVESGETRTIEYDGSRALTIGRAEENRIVLATQRASRMHAEIIGEGGRFTLIDAKSGNGTTVNGEQTRRAALSAGSEIRIGEARIIFGEIAPRAFPQRQSAQRQSPQRQGQPPHRQGPSAPIAGPSRPTTPRPRAVTVVVAAPKRQRAVATGITIIALIGILWVAREFVAAPISTNGDASGDTVLAKDHEQSTLSDASLGTTPSTTPRPPNPLPTAGSQENESRAPGSLALPPLSIDPNDVPSDDGASGDLDSSTPSNPHRPDALDLDEWLDEEREMGIAVDRDAPPDPDLEVTFEPVDGQTQGGPAAAELPPPVLQIIADAWPPGSRTIGYEYNQKNHGSTPGFVGRDGSGFPERNAAKSGPKYRVIGVEVSPRDLQPGVQMRLRSRQVQKGEKLPLSIPGPTLPDRIRRYFALEEPKDRVVSFELLSPDGRTVIATSEIVLPDGGRTTPLAAEAIAIMEERQREEWERSQLITREVQIEVFDDLRRPVPGATVMLLIEGGGLTTFEGTTDEEGRFHTRVVPGSYTVLVHADVPEPKITTEQTSVKRLPRLLSLQGRIGAEETKLSFKPERSVKVAILDEGETPLEIESIWVTPAPIAEAYRYEQIAQQIAARGRLETGRQASGGLRLILGDLPVELGVLCRTADGEPVLITETVTPQREDLTWAFQRDRFAKIEFDPARGAGGVTELTGEIVAVSRYRERFPIQAKGAWRAYVMPGKFRVTLAATLASGTAQFLPYAVDLASGQTYDITPRAPWNLTLYQKRKDREQQLWLAVVDAGGRILSAPPGEPGRIIGLSGEVAKIDQELSRFAWQEAERLLGVDLGKLRFETTIPYGSEEIRALATIDQLRTFNAAGSSATAPGVFEDRIMAILPEIQRTIEGSLESTGLPDGLRRIHLELDIFLPPGIGGTGGGGVITLDNAVMYRYACAGDPLPGAYRHEYGHNMGFGHDPYMMLAEGGSATDEKLFGALAFRLLHSGATARTYDHLLSDKGERGLAWSPSPSVFTALRALYGPDVHKKLITERRASEQTLVLHSLSSIERIATLYSLALDRNVAWVFRAHGWPVFDARVDLGASAVKFQKSHPRQLNYTHVQGTEIRSWWVLDFDSGLSPLEWQRVQWPSGNIDLAIHGEPIESNRRFLLFRRIVVLKNTDARILCASDVGLEVRVNGQAIGVYDPSPQQFQPAHDELMLNQKRPLPVYLPKGENFIEVAVNQPPGSRGFVLALATPAGKPLRVGLEDDAPPGEDSASAKPFLVATRPVLGGSFEDGWKKAWIEGATTPQGSLRITTDDKTSAVGDTSLRIELVGSGSGAIIQRVFIPPGETYTLTAALRTEDFKGEAFVGLFTGELGGWFTRTEPLRKPNQPWKAFKSNWSPGTSRVVYVACYVKGNGGTVWFDGVQLEKIK